MRDGDGKKIHVYIERQKPSDRKGHRERPKRKEKKESEINKERMCVIDRLTERETETER